ncbi:MAG: MaoC family dehydratase [Burkholderiales bacterium]|nr:MaoC family dehydratase [Burkholderiales bacterium]
MKTAAHERLAGVGEKVTKTVRFSRHDIATFARMSLDDNPLHRDVQLAQRARFGEIIASGQQSAAVLMGVLATHFTRCDDGVARQMLCLNMNFAFKRPLFADQDIQLEWTVAGVEWSTKLQGIVAHLDGRAGVEHASPAVVARGTILLTLAGAEEPLSVAHPGDRLPVERDHSIA